MWKELFAPHILQRGYDYYLEGRVWEVEQLKDRTLAIVSGTEEYQVTLWFDAETTYVKDMKCDCPYAADGAHCKHEAAVLYKLSEKDEDNNGVKVKSPMEDQIESIQKENLELEEIISRLPEDEVRDLLFSLAQNDHVLRDHIIITYGNKLSERKLLELRNNIGDIKYSFCDRSGFVDWRNASDFIGALKAFLRNKVHPLIDRGFLKEAFELTCQVFLTIGNTDIDDDGDVAYGAEACCDCWQMIADRADDTFQMKMYRWMQTSIENEAVIDYMEEYLDSFMMSGFHSRELLQMCLEILDRRISYDETRYQANPRKWKEPYWLTNKVLNRIQTMKELGMPKDDILQYYERYSYLYKVILALAEEYHEDNNISKAIRILRDEKQREADNADAVCAYSRRLIDYYRESKDLQKLEEELLFQITKCNQSNMYHIDILREMVDEKDWIGYREQILKAKTCKGIKKAIYAKENMLPELMKEIEDSGSISQLEKYEKILREQYSDKIRDMYAEYVRKEADRVSNRSQYRYLVRDLKKITRYPGGQELARSIANQWRKEYSRKPAFMDELRKAGF